LKLQLPKCKLSRLKYPVFFWGLSTFVSLIAILTVSAIRKTGFRASVITWDGAYYFDIIKGGYLRELPMFDGKVIANRNAFFPVYPKAVYFLDKTLPGDAVVASLILNLSAGLLATIFVYCLAKDLIGEKKALYATALFSFFPGSFVFLWMYSEAITALLVVCALWALAKRKILFSSLIFAVASASRPNAMFMALSVPIFLIFDHLRSVKPSLTVQYLVQSLRASLKSLAYGLISISGFLFFMLFLDKTTKVDRAWFRIQREGWQESKKPFYSLAAYGKQILELDFSVRLLIVVISSCIYVAIMVLIFLYTKKTGYSALSIAFAIPSVLVILLAMSNLSTVSSLRFGIIAIPIFIAISGVLSERALRYWIISSSILLFGFCFFYSWGYNTPFLMGSP